MKPSEVSKLLGVSAPTVRKWSTEFGDYLSPGGRGGDERSRFYSDDDLRVLHFAQTERKRGTSTESILASLAAMDGDYSHLDSPVDAPTAITPMGASAADAKLIAQVTILTGQINILKQQIERLETERDADKERIIELTGLLARAEESLKTVALETELKLWREGRLKPDKEE